MTADDGDDDDLCWTLDTPLIIGNLRDVDVYVQCSMF